MNSKKWAVLVMALICMAGAAGLLTKLRANQRLGTPGVRTSRIPGSNQLQVDLPERVLDFGSERREVEQVVLHYLPADTSYGQRLYKAPDGFQTAVNVVLMGGDRTSLHKPQFCLEAQGWHIDNAASEETRIHLDRPVSYDLPVMKLVATKSVALNDRTVAARGVYVYWFVSGHEYTAQHWQRMLWMAEELVRTGVLERWAYVTYFAVCAPGQEDATFERMKKLIAASVPEFQLVPRPDGAAGAARQ